MDPVTHTMTGAALARAGLDRRTPLAAATLVLAANAPDVDVLAYLEGPYAALAHRRGLTHGLPALLVLPFVVAGAVLTWDRWVRRARRPELDPARPRSVLVLAALGLATHPVLDWMNIYGMRWLLPLRPEWTYGDALFIVDPWIWLVLGGALFLAEPSAGARQTVWLGFWALAAGLVVLAPVPLEARVGWCLALSAVLAARFLPGWVELSGADRLVRRAGIVTAAYMAVMVGLDLAASRQVARVAEAAGVDGVRGVMVAPRPADPLAGDVVVRTGTSYVVGEYSWLGRPAVRLETDGALPIRHGPGLGPETLDRVAAAATASPRARDFLVWSRFPLWTVRERPGGWSVRIEDMRYRGRGSLGGLVVELDDELSVRPPDAQEGADP